MWLSQRDMVELFQTTKQHVSLHIRNLDRRMEEEAWGSGVIDRVSADLRAAFPEMDGLSPRNLRRMRAFYRAYPPDAVASRRRWAFAAFRAARVSGDKGKLSFAPSEGVW